MKFVIETARDQHHVRDEGRLRELHQKRITSMSRRGVRTVQLHDVDTPKDARVNHGLWLFDCECGAGVAADPDFSAGYCFACGAVHTQVTFPPDEDRLNIEHVLLARPRSENRNWEPGETLVELAVQNAEHEVKF